MKYLIFLFVGFLCFPLKSEINIDIINSMNSDSLFYQEILSDTLILTNKTNKIISVTGIGLSCGCTVVSESQFDILANSVKRVPFSVDLEHTSNEKIINIEISTSTKDTLLLKYKYSVKEFLRVEPRLISIYSPNDFVKYEFELVNTSENNIQIMNSKVLESEGSEVELIIQKTNISPGEVINGIVSIDHLANQNIGTFEIEYSISNSKILKKNIEYIINKGK